MSKNLQVLFVEPFYGGSHKAFVEGWQDHSRHEFTILGLPPHKWKWRMRHGAITFARQVNQAFHGGSRWDVIVCSEMLSLAEFRGLVSRDVAELPVVCYFHENQLNYPTAHGELADRDYHFVFSNFATAVAADCNWFNSRFHKELFFDSMRELLQRMPDFRPLAELEEALEKSVVQHPGVEQTIDSQRRHHPPLKILWPHRWEYDKNPDDFFAALRLVEKQVDFRLIVLGESFQNVPPVFADSYRHFADRILQWGYVEDRRQYLQMVQTADIAVSTASHEFFGIAMMEAAAAGVIPFIPNRLAYPEVFAAGGSANSQFFYDGTIEDLADKIIEYDSQLHDGSMLAERQESLSNIVNQYHWPHRAQAMDNALDELVASPTAKSESP